MKKRILIVCAHPDDEVLGMGGTLAKLASEGHNIAVLFLADGEASRGSQGNDIGSDLIETRKKSACDAADILGIGEIYYEHFPDNKMDSVALLDIVKAVEQHITQFKPDVIYTHYAHDLNIDHRVTFNAVMTASRAIKGNTYPKEIYSFEVASSSEWTTQERFKPNIYIGISDQLETKIKALKCYDQEMRDFPHPRSYEAIEACAKLRGSEAALIAAEGFICVRNIQE